MELQAYGCAIVTVACLMLNMALYLDQKRPLMVNQAEAYRDDGYSRWLHPRIRLATAGNDSRIPENEARIAAYADKLCTEEMIDDYVMSRDALPRQGTWDGDEFHPLLCRLAHNDTYTEALLERCLERRNITRIMTIGDTSGARYFSELLTLVNHTVGEGSCSMVDVRPEGPVPDSTGYGEGGPRLPPVGSPCWFCNIRRARCTFLKKRSLVLEHVSVGEPESTSPEGGDEWSVLRYHLAVRRPDVILMFVPGSDVSTPALYPAAREPGTLLVTRRPKDPLAAREVEMVQYMEVVLGHATTHADVPVFVMAATAQVPEKKGEHHLNYNNVTVNKVIEKRNTYVLKHVKKAITRTPSSNIHAFFDLFPLSARRGDWNIDGVQYQPEWYMKMIRYIIQALCEKK